MFKIEVDTGFASFKNPITGEDDDVLERNYIRSLLAKVSFDLEHGENSGIILDFNGNKVGSWSI